MLSKIAVALLLVFGAMACQGPVFPPRGALRAQLPGAQGLRWLGVWGAEGEGAQWFLQEGQRVRRLPSPPVALFPDSLSPSPDGRYLAVISVGEGHPMLDILDLERVLAGNHGEHSLRTLDPYPGFIELAGWEGDRLQVRSDRSLTTCDQSGRAFGSETFEPPVLFLIDVESGAITRR